MPPQRDPGGRFTIFSVVTLAGAIAGFSFGFITGYRIHWALGIISGLAGLYLGSLPGRFLGDYGIMSLVRELNAQDTPTLRSRLLTEYHFAHFIIMILLQRGEPRDELTRHALQMLLSDNPEERWQGWRAIGLNLPETAAALEGIDPRQSPDAYKEKVQTLINQTPPPPLDPPSPPPLPPNP